MTACHYRFILLVWATVGGLPLVGCGSPTSPPKTVPVAGRVTLAGQPLASGWINFYPSDERAGPANRPATGVIREDGRYVLSSFTAGDGAVPGAYRVSVKCLKSAPTIENPNLPEQWAIAERYGNVATSGLKANVPADSNQPLEINFLLTP